MADARIGHGWRRRRRLSHGPVSTRPIGTKPPFRPPHWARWCAMASIPTRTLARTTCASPTPATTTTAAMTSPATAIWPTRPILGRSRIGSARSSACRRSIGAEWSGCTSTGSTTAPTCGSTAGRWPRPKRWPACFAASTSMSLRSVSPGASNALAVRIHPLDFPGDPVREQLGGLYGSYRPDAAATARSSAT